VESSERERRQRFYVCTLPCRRNQLTSLQETTITSECIEMTGESKEILVSTVKPTITQAAIANFPGSPRLSGRKELRKNPTSRRNRQQASNAGRLQIPSPLVDCLVREETSGGEPRIETSRWTVLLRSENEDTFHQELNFPTRLLRLLGPRNLHPDPIICEILKGDWRLRLSSRSRPMTGCERGERERERKREGGGMGRREAEIYPKTNSRRRKAGETRGFIGSS